MQSWGRNKVLEERPRQPLLDACAISGRGQATFAQALRTGTPNSRGSRTSWRLATGLCPRFPHHRPGFAPMHGHHTLRHVLREPALGSPITYVWKGAQAGIGLPLCSRAVVEAKAVARRPMRAPKGCRGSVCTPRWVGGLHRAPDLQVVEGHPEPRSPMWGLPFRGSWSR